MLHTEFRQGTDEWREARVNGIGSSDAPVIVGESPYRSIIELWAEKTGAVPVPEPDQGTARLFRIGHLMEPVLLDLYREETGRKVHRVGRMIRSRERDYMFASLDGKVPGSRRIVECKWTNARRWNSEEVPGDVIVQVQHAMFVAEAEVADVVALVGSDLRIVEVPRDEELIADLLHAEADFWQHVRDGSEPPVDGTESARRTLQALHPREESPLEPAPAEVEVVAHDLLRAKDQAKAIESGIGAYENTLRFLIGDREGYEAEDFRVTWKRSKDSERVGWEEVAKAYRKVIEQYDTGDGPIMGKAGLDAIESLYTVVTPGPRVLRLTDRRNRG